MLLDPKNLCGVPFDIRKATRAILVSDSYSMATTGKTTLGALLFLNADGSLQSIYGLDTFLELLQDKETRDLSAVAKELRLTEPFEA